MSGLGATRTVTRTTTEVSGGPELIKAVAQVLSSAAWPIGLIVLAVLFKVEIRRLIDRLRSVKGPGFEFTTEELLDRLAKAAPVIPAAEAEATLGAPVEEVVKLGKIDAIVTSWVKVEHAINRLFNVRPVTQPIATFGTQAHRSPPYTVRHLLRMGIINESLKDRIMDLSRIRNQVVHQPDEQLSEAAIEVFVETAADVVKQLQLIEAQERLRPGS